MHVVLGSLVCYIGYLPPIEGTPVAEYEKYLVKGQHPLLNKHGWAPKAIKFQKVRVDAGQSL